MGREIHRPIFQVHATIFCMKKAILLLCVGLLAACQVQTPQPVLLPTETVVVQPSDTVQPTAIPTETPAPTATPTPSPLLNDRPVFLAWPLPANIGVARISQYPNTPWSWNYLGLNAGYQCPPMFGYLLDLSSLPYWRDINIPEVEDKAQADPHNFEMVACYTDEGEAGSVGHAGTDIKAVAGTPIYAAAYGKIMDWRASGLTAMIVIKHCLAGAWDETGQCVGGRQWYTTYMHLIPDESLFELNKNIPQGTLLGTVYDQGDNSHLHFEVGEGLRSYSTYVNPWGADEAPWLGCMWLDQALCTNPDPAYQRMALQMTTGEVLLRSGQAEAQPVSEAQGAQEVRLWGSRMAFVDAVNSLFIQDEQGKWAQAAENVQGFQLSDVRSAYLSNDQTLWVREQLQTEWQRQAESVQAFSLADTRLGYLDRDGILYVKEGDLAGEWVPVAEHVLAFQLVDNRIAYLNQQRELYVNEGGLLAEFELMGEDVTRFEVSNVRLGMLNSAGQFQVKEAICVRPGCCKVRIHKIFNWPMCA
jgi:murein DD-endopeptidase MepM/ murein hydrolase activator NlpD